MKTILISCLAGVFFTFLFLPPVKPQATETAPLSLTEDPVLKVVSKVNHNMFGTNLYGFLVQDGVDMKFIKIDKGSALDVMKTPTMLIKVITANGAVYLPLDVN
jgi:hypothetical protein